MEGKITERKKAFFKSQKENKDRTNKGRRTIEEKMRERIRKIIRKNARHRTMNIQRKYIHTKIQTSRHI